jgi:small subunit ribosomal protein S5
MAEWTPKTRLGKLVAEGKITTMSDALRSRLPIREPEIIDILLPDLADEVLDVNMVQRMTDSGRRVKFAITVVVGNRDGFVGVGRAKGKEVGPAIRKAIENAKLNIIEVKRGCGSWECGCMTPHSLPFTVRGKVGSVVVTLRPAPRGTGLAVGDIAKSILQMAGISDAWGMTGGHSKTTINYSLAVFEALRQTMLVKVTDEQKERLKIVSGPVGIHIPPAAEAASVDQEAQELVDREVEDIPDEKEIEKEVG